jgi:hypothetical protein
MPRTNQRITRRVLSKEVLWLAVEFLQSCSTLSESLSSQAREGEVVAERPLLFLCHHGIELFFKGAVMSRGWEPPKTHNLSKLHGRYTELYPDHPVDIPTAVARIAQIDAGLFPKEAVELGAKLHERLRYVTQTDGRVWPLLPDFDVELFERELGDVTKAIWGVCIPILFASR